MNLEDFSHQISILVEVHVNPSESIARVVQLVKNLIPSISDELIVEDDLVSGDFDGDEALHHIYKQFRSRRIISAARRLLNNNRNGEESWLLFNKQAAYSGVVAICEDHEESPLGPVRITFTSQRLSEFIDWIAPRA